jgi:alkylhydroperoxidase/carboxymuconolactone decarboxylase family protein YurZ
MQSKKKTSGDLKRRLNSAAREERQELLAGLPYDVGYGKPPKGTRFQPGQSGNRRGRPAGSRNWGEVLEEEMRTPIDVSDGGRRRKLPKGQVALRQVANKAATGDLKALSLAVELLRKAGRLQEESSTAAPLFNERDLHALGEVLSLLAPSANGTVTTEARNALKQEASDEA